MTRSENEIIHEFYLSYLECNKVWSAFQTIFIHVSPQWESSAIIGYQVRPVGGIKLISDTMTLINFQQKRSCDLVDKNENWSSLQICGRASIEINMAASLQKILGVDEVLTLSCCSSCDALSCNYFIILLLVSIFRVSKRIECRIFLPKGMNV